LDSVRRHEYVEKTDFRISFEYFGVLRL